MSSFCSDEKVWFELLTRIICDTEPVSGADIAYMFGQTTDNQSSPLKELAWLWTERKISKIALSSVGEWGKCHSGFPFWKGELKKAGVADDAIYPVVPEPDLPPCTDSEARGLVRLAKQKKWHKIFVVSPPLHIVRAFISTVSAARRLNSEIMIYSRPGISDDWQAIAVHSQMVAKGPRKNLLDGELERIICYHQQGSLISGEDVLKYLDWRDAQK